MVKYLFVKLSVLIFLLGKKRNRERNEKTPNNKIEELPTNVPETNQGRYERNKDVEVKLICDLPNEDMKKAFSKSVLKL